MSPNKMEKRTVSAEHVQYSTGWKIGHSKAFKEAILALFLTDFWTLNSGLICQTLGMAGLPLPGAVHERNYGVTSPQTVQFLGKNRRQAGKLC
jgi:hypothetical protein